MKLITSIVKSRGVLLIQFEVVVLLPVLLAGWWVFGYLGGLDWSSENSYKFNWHPLAMIIAFILLLGNAAVSYRLFPFGRSTNKKIHATLNLLAIVFIVFGLVAVLEYHADWGYNNFYSLHSWCGLVTLTAFIALALFSAAVFQDFDRTKLTELRGNFKPLHIFLGVFLVFSAVIAIETGIVEKAMFREKSGDLVWENYTTEGFLINLLCSSVLLVLLYTIYILYTLSTVIVQEPLFPHSPGNSRLQT